MNKITASKVGVFACRSSKYKKAAFEGDELLMETWIETLGKIASERRYKLTRIADKALIFKGKTDWVFVDKNSFRPSKIPEEIKKSFG